MLASVQDSESVLDHPKPTFLEKLDNDSMIFDYAAIYFFSAKKVIGVSKWKHVFIKNWQMSLLPFKLRFER